MRRIRRGMVVLGIAVLGAASLPAVASGSTPRQATGGGTLRIGADQSTAKAEFDPANAQIVSFGPQQGWLYGTLLRATPSGKVVPDLAESVTVVDPLTIKVVLKDDLVFTDGTPVDAEAYKFSMERMISSTAGRDQVVSQVESVTVDSPLEFTIKLTQPVAGAITRLLQFCDLGCAYSPTALQNGADFDTDPVGAGPYTLVSFTPGQEYTLEKNPDYWDAKNVTVERVQFKHVPGTAAVTALSSGEMDWPLTGLGLEEARQLEGAPGVTTKTTASGDAMLRGILCKNRPPFDSLEVRQALNYATDRDDLNEKLYDGMGEPMWGWFASDSPNYNPELEGIYDHSPKKAKKLLAKAGASDLTFDMLYLPGYQNAEAAAQILQQQWAESGITANLKPLVNITDFYPNADAGPIYIFPFTQSGIPKVSSSLSGTTLGNVCQWSDPELDALITEAQGLPEGSPELAEVWHEISDRTVKQGTMLFGVFGTETIAYNSDGIKKLKTVPSKSGVQQIYAWGTKLAKS